MRDKISVFGAFASRINRVTAHDIDVVDEIVMRKAAAATAFYVIFGAVLEYDAVVINIRLSAFGNVAKVSFKCRVADIRVFRKVKTI